MNMPDPQTMTKEWMAQISNPEQWKTWFNMVPQPAANPIAGILQDAGASIKPDVIEQLKNAYVAKLTGLWTDFMAGKTPELKDRRFAAPAWHASPLSAFNAAAYLLNAEFLTAMAEAVEATPHKKQ